MGTLATKLVLLPPRDPESKGVVERRNGWFETSSMPGWLFASPADFNTQFTDWLARANARVVRTIKAAPVEPVLDADRAAILPLPPIPLHLGWRNKIRLGRDYNVRLDTNDHSVDPSVIGRMVEGPQTWNGCVCARRIASWPNTTASGPRAGRSSTLQVAVLQCREREATLVACPAAVAVRGRPI